MFQLEELLRPETLNPLYDVSYRLLKDGDNDILVLD